MPIRHERFITRAMLRAEPDALFVFGDNMQRKGLGGQAKEMRGEPNAVGIPTKRAPSNHPGAFFDDSDLGNYWSESATRWARLLCHARVGGTVVLPADGIGTGRARLKECAPRIWQEVQRDLAKLHAAATAQPRQDEGSERYAPTEGAPDA